MEPPQLPDILMEEEELSEPSTPSKVVVVEPETPSKAPLDPETFAWTPNTIRAVAEAYIEDQEARRNGPTYLETLDAFTNFLTAYIHTLLYVRNLYPKTSFLHVRFHNTSAYQNRHPWVCQWINDALEAVREELFLGTVSRIGVAIFSYGNGKKNDSGGREGTGDVQIMERYMIDVSDFPIVHPDNLNTVVEWESSEEEASSPEDEIEDEEGMRTHRRRRENGAKESFFANNEDTEDEPEEEGEEEIEDGWIEDEEDVIESNEGMYDEAEEEHEESAAEHEEHEREPHVEGSLDKAAQEGDKVQEGAPHAQGEDGQPLQGEEDDRPRYDLNLQPSLAEQMRAALIALISRAASLKPLPPKCSYNICMELRDEADIDPPVEHPQHWIPVQPSMQKSGRQTVFEGEPLGRKYKRKRGEDLENMRYTPIRTVETGAFRFETWIEEGPAKFRPVVSSQESKVKFGPVTSSDEQETPKAKPVPKQQPALKEPMKSSETPKPKGILKNKDTPVKAKVSFSSSGDTIIK